MPTPSVCSRAPLSRLVCPPRDVVEDVGVEHPRQQFERADHPRAVPAGELAIQQEHPILLDRRQRRPARPIGQVGHVALDLRDRATAWGDDEHLGVERPYVRPIDRPAVLAGHPEAVLGAEPIDALGDPQPVGTQRVRPFETDDPRGPIVRDPVGDGLDPIGQGRAQRRGAVLPVERRPYAVDGVQYVGDRTRTDRYEPRFRIEPFHRGDGHAFGHGTHLTERLGHQQVRLGGGKGILAHPKGGVFAVSVVRDRIVDRGGIVRRPRSDRALGDDRQRLDRRRVVTPVRAADERVDRADAGDDLGGAGEQGDGTHVNARTSYGGGEKRVRTPTAVSFDLFGTLVSVPDRPDPAPAIRDALIDKAIAVPEDWADAYGEVHVPLDDGEELSLVEHVRAALASRDVTADPATVEAAVRAAFAVPVERRDGATVAIEAARGIGPVGILSNCSVPGLVEHVIGAADLPAVDAVVTSVDCGYRKPDRRAFAAVADRLGVAIEGLCHVGDDPRADGRARGYGATVHLIEDVPLPALARQFEEAT